MAVEVEALALVDMVAGPMTDAAAMDMVALVDMVAGPKSGKRQMPRRRRMRRWKRRRLQKLIW